MATDMWEAGADVWAIVQDLISKYHPNLALVDKSIAVIFRGKASKSGGQVVLGTSKKASSLFKVLGKNEYRFILEIAGDEWGHLSDEQRIALIDHLLCACKVEEDEKSGDLKLSIASPEVSFFWDELKRHGDWRPRPQQEESNPMNVESVISMMGDKDDEETVSAPTPVPAKGKKN
jgi:hypothetical protein